MITTLAVLFVLGILGLVFYGFSIVMRRTPTAEEPQTERCSICRERFSREDLIEREIGDYKVLLFCPRCIQRLSDELSSKRGKHKRKSISNASA